MEEFHIGQIFEEEYPPAAAEWCNRNLAYLANYGEKGYIIKSMPQPDITLKDYDKVMEQHLLSERVARGYTNREPSDYANSAVERWAQDARDWIAHRDEVMLYALQVENHYQETGEAPTIEEFKAALPVIHWTIE